MGDAKLTPIEIGLTTAIVAVKDEEPYVLVAGEGDKKGAPAGLPSGPFDPVSHRTFEIGLRAWVAAQTALDVGYVEQLYTFGDRGRHARPGDTGPHAVSVGYLALTRIQENASARAAGAGFEPWYRFFPWEDWREGRPAILDEAILPPLQQWARGQDEPKSRWHATSGCSFASASAARPGTKRKCWNATSFFTTPVWSRRPHATAAFRRRRWSRSVLRCGSTIAASWRLRLRGSAPS